jgi:hypothetical protein
MKSEETKCIIVSIGNVESQVGSTKKKQILFVKEECPDPSERPGKCVDNFHEIEVYNDKIDKFDLLGRFKAGQTVKLRMHVNGSYHHTSKGESHKKSTVLSTIHPM